MSKAKRLSEYDAQILELILRFREENANKPFENRFVAAWAMKEKMWSGPLPGSLPKVLKKELSRVAKKARHIDQQGRSVRTLHAAKIALSLSDGKPVQRVLWDHLDTMSLDHAQTSFTQRWVQIAGSSTSLSRDKDSFNQNNPNAAGRPIQLTFNFDQVVDQAEKQEIQEVPLPSLVIN